VPGIWFPFGIGVSRTQYVYAIAVPLLALLIVRTIQRGPESDESSRASRESTPPNPSLSLT